MTGKIQTTVLRISGAIDVVASIIVTKHLTERLYGPCIANHPQHLRSTLADRSVFIPE